MVDRAKNVSDETRRDAGLSDADLWLRYFELGGMSTPDEVRSYLRGGGAPSAHDHDAPSAHDHDAPSAHDHDAPSAHDHDVLAQALNERFSELGRDHPVRYAEACG